MRKLLKFIAWLVGILIVLVVALTLLVPLFFDPNAYKDRIISEVKQATGRDLSITGKIGFSVFPWLGVELNGLSLSNPPGFGETRFAAMELAKVRVKLVPLLTERTLEADTVQIEGLDLYLAKSKKGATNWSDLTGQQPAPGESKGQPPAETSADKGLAAFTIGGVSIQKAHVVWDDQSTGQHYEIKDLQLKTGSLTPGKAVDVRLEMALASRQPAMQGWFKLSGSLNSKPEQQYFALEGLEVNLQVSAEGLPPEGLEAKLTGNLVLEYTRGYLEAKDLRLSSGDLVLLASVQGQGLQTKPLFTGTIKLQEFTPRQWFNQFGIASPQTSDPTVLKRLSLSSGFNAQSNLVMLDNLLIQLDDTRVSGQLELLNPADPTYKFNLDVDKIDLDRYLPPQPEETAGSGPATSSTAAQKEEPLFPVDMLRKLNVDGSLRVDSLTLRNIKAKAIQLKVTAKDGKLQLDQQIGRFYDGMIKGGVDLDVRGKTPKLSIAQEASRIQAGPMLRDLAKMDKLEGTGGFKTNLATTGQTVSQLKRGLNGTLNFNFTDGAVKGFNLAYMLREAQAKLSGKTLAVSTEPQQTDFSELSGSGVFNNGILSNQDLLAKSPFLRVDGAGKVNIVMENLDYTVRVVVVNTSTGQGGKELDQLVGVPVPVHLEGPWSKPEWKIDLAKVLAEHQKARLKEKVEEKVQEKLPELQEKLPEGLKDKLQEGLKGLF